MEDLPIPIMVDILSRLPVKTIIHCKCVCKKWQDLISDSYFADNHLSRSPAGIVVHHHTEHESKDCYKPGILKWVEVEDELGHHHLHHDSVMGIDLNLSPILYDCLIHVVGSVNGLVCLCQDEIIDNAYICNPITREYMSLPRQHNYTENYAGIDYHFGVGSLTGEYKVLRILQEHMPPNSISHFQSIPFKAEIYTLGTNQWRSLGQIPYWLTGFFWPFLNGHAHSVIAHKDSDVKLCAFDYDNETSKLFPSPPLETKGESKVHLGSLAVLKGCLCLSDTFDSEFRIWVMKEYGIEESWHKKLVIKQSISPDLNWIMLYVIDQLRDGTILMVYYEDELLAYNPQMRRIEETDYSDRSFPRIWPYRPSFFKLQNFECEKVHVF